MALELVNKLPYDHPYRWDGTPVGGVKLWRPDELSSLAIWLDAADSSTITLNGSTVSQWDDKSGNGNHAAQAAAAIQPVYSTGSLNSNQTIDFRTNKYLDTSGVALRSLAVVVKLGTYINVNGLVGSFDNDYGVRVIPSGYATINSNDWFQRSGSTVRLNGENTISGAVTSWHILTASVVDDPTFLFNRIGGYFTGREWNGEIAEVIYTTSTLATNDLAILEGYLAWKWGLESELSADHPYKTTPPTA